jgi:hypothetical protein
MTTPVVTPDDVIRARLERGRVTFDVQKPGTSVYVTRTMVLDQYPLTAAAITSAMQTAIDELGDDLSTQLQGLDTLAGLVQQMATLTGSVSDATLKGQMRAVLRQMTAALGS